MNDDARWLRTWAKLFEDNPATSILVRHTLRRMCNAFGGHYWIGQFTYPSSDPRGKDERILALCMAAAILENP